MSAAIVLYTELLIFATVHEWLVTAELVVKDFKQWRKEQWVP